MIRHKELFSALALVVPFVVGAVTAAMNPTSASATEELVELCIAAGIDTSGTGAGACEYAAWDAPWFQDEVCWDGAIAVVKSDLPCAVGSIAYYLERGEVIDVSTGEVAGYAALPSTCKYIECKPGYEGALYDDGVACCQPGGDCTPPDANGNCPMGDVTWCKEIEELEDGTILCHE